MSNVKMSKFSNQEVIYFAVRLGMSVGGFAGAILGYWVSHTFLGGAVGGSIGAVVGFGTGVLVAFITLVILNLWEKWKLAGELMKAQDFPKLAGDDKRGQVSPTRYTFDSRSNRLIDEEEDYRYSSESMTSISSQANFDEEEDYSSDTSATGMDSLKNLNHLGPRSRGNKKRG